MTKSLRITSITLLVLLGLGIVGYFVAEALITSKLENFFNTKLPETIRVDYKSIDVNILRGSVVMVQPKILNKSGHTKANVKIELDSLMVDGFGYWNYLINNRIHVESVQLRRPKVHYNHDAVVHENYHKNSNLDLLKQEIKVDQFNIQNGTLSIRDIETDSTMLYTKAVTVNIMGIVLDGVSVKNHIPFKYGDYSISFNGLFYNMGDYERLTINSAQISPDKAQFDTLKIFTKYSKAKLNQIISTERDHFDVTIPSLVLEHQKFGYAQDSLFYFNSPKVILQDPEMYIYRNKLIRDDLTHKHLYSKILRSIKFDLTLTEVILKNATIVYSEKVNADMQAGKLSFTNMNANIKNISNTYGADQKTSLNIDAVFMAKTPIKVLWEFDVNDVNDAFVFKTEIGKLPSPDLNPFSQPNLKVRFEGELLQTYVTISGNNTTSHVNMRTNYEDFKVVILDKEGEKKNKVLSAIVNLFIKKNSDTAEDGFRESSKDSIERDKTKSIFNFLWLNLKAGLVSVMTGNGKQ